MKRILLISPIPSHPAITGASIRPTFLAPHLRSLGFEVHFLFCDYVGGSKKQMRDFWGIDKFHYVPYKRWNIKWELKRLYRTLGFQKTKLHGLLGPKPVWRADPKRCRKTLNDYFDIAIGKKSLDLDRKFNFEAVIAHFVIMSPAFESFSGRTKKIIDTQEVFSIGREKELKNGEKLWIDIGPEEEARGLEKADIIWTSQDKDASTLESHFGKKVMMLSHFLDKIPSETKQPPKTKKIAFVGSSHSANVDGLLWFNREVYPLIQGEIEPKDVLVIGNIKDRIQGRVPFTLLGVIKDLKEVLDSVRLVISPIQAGTGIKCKNLDAFAYGKPVVSTRFAAIGIEEANGRSQLVAETPNSFAECILKIIRDDEKCQSMMLEANLFASNWNKKLFDRLKSCLIQEPK